ncbi:probable methyltransferase-like protein 15 homolog [Anopheles ziemanni]|uniref:probable methyltransferase-like protein 15 homolog n=1 Tax=Anopheles coustani TaxID=139045 RepID=UPI00265B04F3|nr:probable methyltransferase-like protein 15 homolog [Anopheles coustani]XP_058172141.1 probable methyltransferase-like protein 15 homolog [Anopheles ziemanni]
MLRLSLCRTRSALVSKIDLERCYSSGRSKATRQKQLAPHLPVMTTETIQFLEPKKDEVFIDMTFGAGGHTRALLEASPGVTVVALDRDPHAHQLACTMAEEYPGRLIPVLGRFSELPSLLRTLDGYDRQRFFNGILFDFGCSSMQFDEASRGFSIAHDSPLDMRMDKDRCPEQLSAAEVLARIQEQDLARILKVYGEEKQSKKIARAIVNARLTVKRIETTAELASIVAHCLSQGEPGPAAFEYRQDKLRRPAHVATKTFQALRIFVNNELNEINYGMVLAKHLLRTGGKLVTIAFHSLEDTIVKRHLTGHVVDDVASRVPLQLISHTLAHETDTMQEVMKPNWRQMTKHVVVPSDDEVAENPRSRSAKLRAAVRLS